ncbi:hypothetical protein [Castellaniella sp.]|uniref:hypothetical protein n=1 Tax=Castellaniella sp. TaxID=1955812 RepID=UPI003A599557
MSLDGTWHRPFTTLELAALQSIYDPDDCVISSDVGANEFGFRVGDVVPTGFFDPPSMDEAMSMIADYARQHNLTPNELVGLFSAGVAAQRVTQEPANV